MTLETHESLALAIYGITELIRYCVNELNFKYSLPDKIQTNKLENRFGKYRQLTDSQHHISTMQLYEIVTKLSNLWKYFSISKLIATKNANSSDFQITVEEYDIASLKYKYLHLLQGTVITELIKN